MQQAAGTREPGHHRADGDVGNTRDFLVRQFFKFPQNQYLTENERQLSHRVGQQPRLPAALRHPLGITIVGGLIVSQALTLYTTPVVFIYLDDFGKWLSGLWRRYYLRPGAAPMAGAAE